MMQDKFGNVTGIYGPHHELYTNVDYQCHSDDALKNMPLKIHTSSGALPAGYRQATIEEGRKM